ncbi:Hypothetical protein PHPALM_614 [Phytophthora palmivora]|uniref:Ubiquitin-like protease family profile domain-containing protein n=1 Tax=Phytophthora palmivora TaxID=4796 RepID=A0A2P4YUD3_9STRA|nr:Hypothetical protein PHPALM_614 [Phytophthora palmivora]
MSSLFRTVAGGDTPPMATVIYAHNNGFIVDNSVALRALSVLHQTQSSPITIQERTKQPPTTASEIMTVLSLRRIESCESQIAMFQNWCFSDHDTRISTKDITLKTGRIVYDVKVFRAMRSWRTAMPRFHAVEETIEWMNNLHLAGWNCDDSWKMQCLDVEEVIDSLRKVDVLASHVLRFPIFDQKLPQEQTVWMHLNSAFANASTKDKAQQKQMGFFVVIHYNADHWCAAAVNFAEFSITIFDPNQTGDRFAALRTYLKAELVPLLPSPPTPNKWVGLFINNCGLFVIVFFEHLLLEVVPVGEGMDTSTTMQFFRYRYIYPFNPVWKSW